MAGPGLQREGGTRSSTLGWLASAHAASASRPWPTGLAWRVSP